MAETKNKGYIYSLSDDSGVRYLGQTVDVKRRYSAHCSVRQNLYNSPKSNWIRSLLKKGQKPVLEVILETDIENLDQEEIRLIAKYRENKVDLLNVTLGGKDLKHINKPQNTKPWGSNHSPLQRIFMLTRATLNSFKRQGKTIQADRVQNNLYLMELAVSRVGKDYMNDKLWERHESSF